jgi:hypothetical protein
MNASFIRKIIYGCLIVAMLLPLTWLGMPPTVRDGKKNPGGRLSMLRDKYDLSQAELGEIDPTSESMKLATLGMRGVAINVLWTMANEYKKKEDFDNFAATVNQITLLAPNFIAVWEFQAHNESYNVSVEYDHYKMRYAWVKKGIDLMIRGTQYNRKDTRLISYLGWFFGQKMGRADEHLQFRELFRNDHDYHQKLTETLKMAMDDREVIGANRKDPDNWLVARKVQLRAVNLVETAGAPIRGKSPVLFYSEAPMYRINYSKAIEDEGWLGEAAKEGWTLSSNDWVAFGRHPVPTSWGHDIQLGDYETYTKRLEASMKKLNELAPGVSDKLREERMAKLRPEEREAVETPASKRSDQQMMLAYEAEPKVQVLPTEIAEAAPAENRREAKRQLREYEEAYDMAQKIDRYRNIVNFKYWKTRCEVEQSETAIAARQAVADAEKAYENGNIDGAKEKYEEAWKLWAKIYDKYPEMMEDIEADDLVESIQKYKSVLTQLEYRGLPQDFPLWNLLEVQRKGKEFLKQVQKEQKMTEEDKKEEKPGEKTEEKKPEEKKPDEKKEEKPEEKKPE